MTTIPRISVVTCSYNQAGFLGRTIDSVLAQDYPNLEHLVVDGMSSDETPQVLARYPHLRVVREPDRGQADAINKGMRLATGDILCFLNSDDTLLPGALGRVAAEIDPARGRHVVMGRCRFIDEHDRFLGIEHPSAFESHRRVLEIWKGHCLPQPAVFWTPEVWRRCGPLDTTEHLVLDYDLFCRFSRRYRFHFIDQPLATYRLHVESKTSSVTDEERLEQAIRVSRRYWGSPLRPQYWRVLGCYSLYRLNRRQRAVQLLRRAREAWRHRQLLPCAAYLAAGTLLGPDMLADKALLGSLSFSARVARRLFKWSTLLLPPRPPAPQTLAWRDWVVLHSDGWAGPQLLLDLEVRPEHAHLRFQGVTAPGVWLRGLKIDFFVDGQPISSQCVRGGRPFDFTLPLGATPPGKRKLKVVSSAYMVFHDIQHDSDYRPVSFKLHKWQLLNREGVAQQDELLAA
jgi:glycosyltransferase involved in cell wall biosynthesis